MRRCILVGRLHARNLAVARGSRGEGGGDWRDWGGGRRLVERRRILFDALEGRVRLKGAHVKALLHWGHHLLRYVTIPCQ